MANLIDANAWEQQIKAKLDPQKQGALDRIVLAGMKTMFSKETHQMILDQISGEGDVVTKLSEGITKLMILLFKQSHGSMPLDLIIPAGGILLAKAAEFLIKSGDQITNEQLATAMAQMQKLIKQQASQDGAQPFDTQPTDQPPEQPTAPPMQPQGLIGQGAPSAQGA